MGTNRTTAFISAQISEHMPLFHSARNWPFHHSCNAHNQILRELRANFQTIFYCQCVQFVFIRKVRLKMAFKSHLPADVLKSDISDKQLIL